LLLKRTGGSWAISLFIIGLAAMTTISVYLASETAHIDMGTAPKVESALSGKSATEPAQPLLYPK
jgi:hypothetical protein